MICILLWVHGFWVWKKARCVVSDCLVSSKGNRAGNLTAIKHLIQVWECGVNLFSSLFCSSFCSKAFRGPVLLLHNSILTIIRLVISNAVLLSCTNFFILIIWHLCSDFYEGKEDILLIFGLWNRATEAGLEVRLKSDLHSAITLASCFEHITLLSSSAFPLYKVKKLGHR